MRAVRYWVSSIILAAGSVAVAPQAMAQQEATTPDSAVAAVQGGGARPTGPRARAPPGARRRQRCGRGQGQGLGDRQQQGRLQHQVGGWEIRLRFRGLVQTDGRFFLSDSAFPVTNNFFVRRARPILEVMVGKYLEFRLQPDFGQGTTVLFDAYSDVKVSPAFAVRVGKFKPPVDLERLQSASDIVFAERALATNLAPNRDIGLQLSGEISGGVLAWQAGVFNGVPDLGNGDGDVSDAKDFAGRVFIQPFKTGSLAGLGVGIAGTTGLERGTTAAPALASYRTPGQQTWFRYTSSTTTPASNVFADGRRSRLAPQAYFYTGPLGLHGEYIQSWQTVSRATFATVKLKHTAWQTTGSVFLTGEKNSWRSATPKKPFDPKAGTFGALELAARYSELAIDDATFPNYAIRGRHADQGQGVGRRAQLVPGAGHQARGGLRAHDLHRRCRHGRSRSRKLRRDPRPVLLLRCTPREATRLTMRTRLAVSGSVRSPRLRWPAPAGRRRRERPSPSPCSTSRTIRRASCTRTSTSVRHVLEGQDRPGRDDPAVARRLGQAGALGHRRPRGRRGHARARLRHRPDRGEGRAPAGQLADAAAQQQLALHVDDRVPRAQGESEEDQGLGRSGAARRLGHHAQPEDVRRRALELPGGVGLRAAAAGRQRGHARRSSSASSTRTCRCSTPAPAARRRRSWSAASATC